MIDGEPPEFATIGQVIERAREILEPGPHAWAAAGAGEEVTLARNRLALNRLALVPRVGRDVSEVDVSTSVVGVPMAMPVFLAPVGALGLFDEGDSLTAARAATDRSTSAMTSILTTARWGDVAATAPERHFFQIYVLGDRAWLSDLVLEVDSYGFGGLCVTMDCSMIGRRDRSLVDGYIWRTGETVGLAGRGWDNSWRARFTWDDLSWLCEQTTTPVIAKGIMTAEDAALAADCGVEAIYVSNHGGRMVDHSVSSIEVLEEVVAAVDPRIDVVIDSGFTRGAEVCAALALGAKAVGIGRLQCWALAAGGRRGLARTLAMIEDEITRTMANIGCASLADLTPDHVRWSASTLGWETERDRP